MLSIKFFLMIEINQNTKVSQEINLSLNMTSKFSPDEIMKERSHMKWIRIDYRLPTGSLFGSNRCIVRARAVLFVATALL